MQQHTFPALQIFNKQSILHPRPLALTYLSPLSIWVVLKELASHRKMPEDCSHTTARMSPSQSQPMHVQILHTADSSQDN